MYQLIKPIFTAAYADKVSDDEDELIPQIGLKKLQESLDEIFQIGERHNASDMLKFIIQILHEDIRDQSNYDDSNSDMSNGMGFFEGGKKLKQSKSKEKGGFNE